MPRAYPSWKVPWSPQAFFFVHTWVERPASCGGGGEHTWITFPAPSERRVWIYGWQHSKWWTGHQVFFWRGNSDEHFWVLCSKTPVVMEITQYSERSNGRISGRFGWWRRLRVFFSEFNTWGDQTLRRRLLGKRHQLPSELVPHWDNIGLRNRCRFPYNRPAAPIGAMVTSSVKSCCVDNRCHGHKISVETEHQTTTILFEKQPNTGEHTWWHESGMDAIFQSFLHLSLTAQQTLLLVSKRATKLSQSSPHVSQCLTVFSSERKTNVLLCIQTNICDSDWTHIGQEMVCLSEYLLLWWLW